MTADPLPQRLHCVGIGGGGLGALAGLLAEVGHQVRGSDAHGGPALERLARAGVPVFVGHAASQLGEAELLIRSAAVGDDNPEVVAARARGLPVLKYSEALGRLMRGRPGVAMAGTHGKTSTTALLAHLLAGAAASGACARPGWVVGGRPLSLPTAARWGDDAGALVVEACEYDDSFLNLSYRVGVVLGVAADHLDWFGDEAGVHRAFQRFAARVPSDGVLVRGAGVPRNLALTPAPGGRVIDAARDIALEDLSEDATGYTGRIVADGWGQGAFRCPLPGRHNLANLQAALAAAWGLGVPLEALLPHVMSFVGVARRLQDLGALGFGPGAGARVIDDFAHHPEELAASLAAVRARHPGRRAVAVFQPHQVSRTAAFMEGFAEALAGFDRVLLCDIFVARDRHPERASETLAALADSVARRAGSPRVECIGPATRACATVAAGLQPDDVCLIMGAGDIDGLAAELFCDPAARVAPPSARARVADGLA